MGSRLELRITPILMIVAFGILFIDDWGLCLVTLLVAAMHEVGHLLAARALHIPMGCLKLDLLGARLEIRGRMLSYGEEWLLCAAGPVCSLFLSAAAGLLWSIFPPARQFSCVSLLLGVLNLLPIRTFDGGRMLESPLAFFFGERLAEGVMRTVSFLFLFLLWAISVYFLLKVGDGLSLFCFSFSLFSRFFDELENV